MLNFRSLSVQSKLIVAFVLLTLVSIGVVSWIGYFSARESLRASAERELVGLERSKAALVGSLLRAARNEVLTLSASRATTDAARELLAAYRQLSKEPVTEEMRADVRRFYREEFVPALTKHAAIEPPQDSLLPTTPAGWYLQVPLHRDRAEAVRRETNQPLDDRQERVRADGGPRGAWTRGGHQAARAGKRHPGRSRNPRRVLQPRTVLRARHQPRQRPLCGEQDGEARAEPAQFAERGRLQSRRFRVLLPFTWGPESLCRLAHFRRPAHDRDHVAQAADRTDQQRPVGQPAVAGGGAGEDRRGLPGRPRSNDAERFAVPDRGPGGVPRHLATFEAHDPHDRCHRQSSERRSSPCQWRTMPPRPPCEGSRD